MAYISLALLVLSCSYWFTGFLDGVRYQESLLCYLRMSSTILWQSTISRCVNHLHNDEYFWDPFFTIADHKVFLESERPENEHRE